MTEIAQEYQLTYKDVTDYENILIRLYHSYLSTNYTAELISIALRHLPEDADVTMLCDLAAEYESVAPLAVDAAGAFMAVYLDMLEGEIPDKDMVAGIMSYEAAKQEVQNNIGCIWLRVSEIFSPKQHDEIIQELDQNLASQQELQEQYDLVLTGNYPTLTADVRQQIAILKARTEQ